MVLHPVKCEAMLLYRSALIGPIQALTINNVVIKVVKSTRCLEVVIDNKLSWNPHLKETIKSFAKKLNLLKFANQQPGTVLFQSNLTIRNLWDPRLGKLLQDPL